MGRLLVSIFGCKPQKTTLANLCGKLIHWKVMWDLIKQRKSCNTRFGRAGIRATQGVSSRLIHSLLL